MLPEELALWPAISKCQSTLRAIIRLFFFII